MTEPTTLFLVSDVSLDPIEIPLFIVKLIPKPTTPKATPVPIWDISDELNNTCNTSSYESTVTPGITWGCALGLDNRAKMGYAWKSH
jgi:hypothetical protein